MKLSKLSVKNIPNRLMSRRRALNIGIGSIVALVVLAMGKITGSSNLLSAFTNLVAAKSPGRNFNVVGTGSLQQRAKRKGIIYGSFPTSHAEFEQNQIWKSTFLRDCGAIVAGCYWDQTRPSVNTFDFQEVDRIANFAATHRLVLRGHPLVWHLATANWMKDTINRQNARQILTAHIQTVVKRYAGRMHSWDVVNEAIDLQDGRADGLKKSPWLEFIGADYIDLAFRTAAKSDPKALLVYNEQNLEYDEAHQTAVLALLTRLKAKGTPVHALGIQSHLRGHRQDFQPQQFRKFLRNIAKLGLKILITELDVIDQELPFDLNQRDWSVAVAYEDYLNVVLAEPAVIAVINWGLSDRYTWLNQYVPRHDGQPSRPLPFDRDYRSKLAWNALARAFDRAPKR
jgi:endo-1,4-beta-xylanase